MLEPPNSQDTRSLEQIKKILETGTLALCNLARHTTEDARNIDAIDGFEEAVRHGQAALSLLRRLRAHFGTRMPEAATACVSDAVESFFAEIPERDQADELPFPL